MKYAVVEENHIITNIIEVEPELAQRFNAHYLGDAALGIGDRYPDEDLQPPREATMEERVGALETEMDSISAAIERGLSL